MASTSNHRPPTYCIKMSALYKNRTIIIDSDSSDDGHSREEKVLIDFDEDAIQSMKLAPTKTSDSFSDDSSSLGGYIAKLRIDVPSNVEEEKKQSLSTEEKKRNLSSGSTSCVDKNDRSDSAWSLDETKKEYFLDNEKAPPGVQWPDIRLPVRTHDQLYDFQRDGVQWIASLHVNRGGGILGDDMGMGKTYTSLSYLGGLMRAGTIKNALVIAPLSVLRSWENEATKILKQCVTNIVVRVLSSSMSVSERRRLLNEAAKQWKNRCYLIITTYGLIRNAQQDFMFEPDNQEQRWNYVVLDEAHNVKNPKAAVSASCREVCANPRTRRLMLSGTPILNNLSELWSLFDFATSGKVLGSLKDFMRNIAKPIEAARDSEATAAVVESGKLKTTQLQTILKPHFLQRLKKDFLKDKLPTKLEIVVWTHLSKKQRQLYQDFLNEDDNVYHIMQGEKISPLIAISALKKLCSHPMLFEGKEMGSLDQNKLVPDSAKLGLTVELVQNLRASNHKTLIFSQSTMMLNIIERVLQKQGVLLSRIDGTTKEQDRQRFVDDFNLVNSNAEVMLLSTKAAGVGLTLTGADSVIVYDPSWTPAEDSQAVDRAYRLGQQKPVTVYRLIAAGSVEEKMYERQVFKDGIQRTVFGSAGKNIDRYFSQSELSELFRLGTEGECHAMEKVQKATSGERLGFGGQDHVLSMRGVVGISRHDGFYMEKAQEEEPPVQAFGGDYKVLGRSQRVLQRVEPNQQILIPPKKPLEPGNEKAQSDQVRSAKTHITNTDRFLLKDVERLRASGHARKALSLGLELLENHNLSKETKVQLHQHLAELGNSFNLLRQHDDWDDGH